MPAAIVTVVSIILPFTALAECEDYDGCIAYRDCLHGRAWVLCEGRRGWGACSVWWGLRDDTVYDRFVGWDSCIIREGCNDPGACSVGTDWPGCRAFAVWQVTPKGRVAMDLGLVGLSLLVALFGVMAVDTIRHMGH